MQICKLNRLVGPNIWANYPVIEAWVDLGRYEDFPSNTLPGFNDKLMAWLPTMIEHRCGVGERGGFFQRMRGGTWLGHVLEHVTLEISSLAHLPVGFGRARETAERGVYKVAIEVLDFRFGEACIGVAHDLIMAAAEGRDYDLPAALRQLRVNADDYCYGPSTQAIVDGAKARLIPTLRLTEGNLVQLGYGKAQRRIWTAETDNTSAVAESIAHDKELTRQLLASVGVPIPEGRAASSSADAWAAAQELGLPVVVKPQNGNKGRGVSIRLEDRASIEAAYSIAEKQDDASGVVVERFIPGRPFRVLVVGEKAVAASGGQPHQLIGDGVHTVDQLAALANQDPQRGDDSAQPLMPFVMDDIALESLRRQGLTRTSVPAAGVAAVLHHNGDLTVDETDRMHPDVAAQCVLAVRTVGLDVAGIDLIAEDISRPLEKQGGALIEVNSSPGLIMHLKPQVGQPRPVGEAIVAQLFAAGQTGRVPLVAVSGTNGKTLVTELIAEMLRSSGSTVGQASSEGLRVGARSLASGDRSNADSMRRALMNPYADAFVFEISEPQVIDEGVLFDRCQVAVVTNVGSFDHLGRQYADETLLGKAVRAPVDIVLPTGFAVLNADDPAVLEMSKFCKGKVVLFARSGASPGVAEHLGADGRAVVQSGEQVVLCQGSQREALLDLAPLTCPELGLPQFLVDDLLAAVAAGVALNLNGEEIRNGVTACVAQGGIAVFDLPVTPARPNGGLLIVTPSRNPSSFRAWGEHIRHAFPGYQAEVLVEPSADWRAADAEAYLEVLGQCFSQVTVALNSDGGAFVEALDTTSPRPNTRLTGRSTPLMDVLDQLLEGTGAAESAMRLPLECSRFRKSPRTPRRKKRGSQEGWRSRLRKTLPMNIESIRALRGPNLWSDETVLEAILVVEKAEVGPAMFARLCGLLPQGMAEELRQNADSPRSPDSPAFWARVAARLTVGLQAAANCGVSYWSSRELKPGKEYRIVAQYAEEPAGRRALELCLELLAAARADRSIDLASELIKLRKLNEDVRLGPSTGCIVQAAQARKIPVRRLTEGSLVQFGQGARMRRIWAAETDRTSAVAESIAQDKELTKSLLDTIGIPVPKGISAKTAEAAWAAAQEIGVPVVVKPRRGNQGRGVSVRLSSRESILAAFANAIPGEEEVIVERHIEGADFRLLVIGGRLIAAARREPPKVVGDGTRTIAELVAIENLDPRRGDDHSTSLSKMRLDEIGREILAEQGLTVDSVPEAGRVVVLRRNANLSTGGSAADVTDTVHPDVARAAIEAAQMIGLDVAGVDVVALNVEEPLEITCGAIVEVNAAPGLRMHVEPSSGQGRPVGAAIIDSMFAPGDDARIPVVAVTGTNGKTTTTRCIAHLLRQRGLRVGMTCTDGIYIEGRRIDTGDCSGPKSARTVLAHPRVDAAVLETARGGMLREGLGFDWCDVAVVTNVGEGDHLGMGGIHTAEELARVKAIPVRRVSERGAAVLNADDPLVVAMAGLCRGAVIFFSRNADAPKIVSHRAAGGKAVTVRDGYIVICTGKDERRVAHVDQLPLTLGGRIGFQIDNLLASVAAGFWLGLSVDALRFGVQTFSSDLGTTPGRFNVLTHRDATVILDYGHNASALLALNEAISRMPHRRRKVVYTAAGDRRDEDIHRQAEIIGSFYDDVYIYEDKCTRGRADGEIIRMMREGFTRATRPPRRVLQKSGELAAIAAAISSLEPGDLLLCQVDQVEVALDFVKGLFRQAEARPIVPIAQFAAAALAALGIIAG